MFDMISALAAEITLGERLSTAGIVTLEGMAVIFCVLALLWGIIELLHRAVYRPEKAPVASEKIEETSPAPVETADVTDNGAIVAAIIAAITASRSEEGNPNGFRVVSFKRASARKTR